MSHNLSYCDFLEQKGRNQFYLPHDSPPGSENGGDCPKPFLPTTFIIPLFLKAIKNRKECIKKYWI